MRKKDTACLSPVLGQAFFNAFQSFQCSHFQPFQCSHFQSFQCSYVFRPRLPSLRCLIAGPLHIAAPSGGSGRVRGRKGSSLYPSDRTGPAMKARSRTASPAPPPCDAFRSPQSPRRLQFLSLQSSVFIFLSMQKSRGAGFLQSDVPRQSGV